MEKNSKIYVAGADTYIGAALVGALEGQGYTGVVKQADGPADLTDQASVRTFFAEARPEYVFVAGGKSGGILANQKMPADLMMDNLLMAGNVVQSAFLHGVRKLMYLASSCSYPRECPQPMTEDLLLTGPLEPTNEAYAVAKIAGIKLCQAYHQQYGVHYFAGIPANVFGPGDDFSLENSHVIAALLRRMSEAKQAGAGRFEVWGSGAPRREFIFVDDLASACIHVMNRYQSVEPINLGSGLDLSIMELARLIRDVIAYDGEIVFDATKPDGMPRKALDTSKLRALGWQAPTSVRAGIEATYRWYRATNLS